MVDTEHFNVSKTDIVDWLNKSRYKSQYIETCCTYREQNSICWRRGMKFRFQQLLVDYELMHFAYVKFYVGEHGEKYALVAGKSGSKIVNRSAGCDLSFSIRNEDGAARKWLNKHGKSWCHTEILIVKTKSTEEKESRKEAFKIERELQQEFDLFGS